MDLKTLRRIVRNPRTEPSVLEEALQINRTEFQAYAVYAALAVHPRATDSVREALLPQLFWRDLAMVIASPHVPDRVRNSAIPILRKRMDRATFGEWKAFARMCPPRLVGWVLKLADPEVFRCLLDNPRLSSDGLVQIIHAPDMTPAMSVEIGNHDRWRNLRKVRLALVYGARTDLTTALLAMKGLLKQDLEEIRKTETLRPLIRRTAEELLRRTSSTK